jgi:hypothetical protein
VDNLWTNRPVLPLYCKVKSGARLTGRRPDKRGSKRYAARLWRGIIRRYAHAVKHLASPHPTCTRNVHVRACCREIEQETRGQKRLSNLYRLFSVQPMSSCTINEHTGGRRLTSCPFSFVLLLVQGDPY